MKESYQKKQLYYSNVGVLALSIIMWLSLSWLVLAGFSS